VVDHVRGAPELGEDIAAADESDRTLWQHREFVRDRLGGHSCVDEERVRLLSVVPGQIARTSSAKVPGGRCCGSSSTLSS
jgi:hypothetical protein